MKGVFRNLKNRPNLSPCMQSSLYTSHCTTESCCVFLRLPATWMNLYKGMIDSAPHAAVMPSFNESHFSWTDLFYSDLHPTYKDPAPVPSLWISLPPEHWTGHHVCEWLQYCCDNYKLDASCIPFSQFNVTGQELCRLTKEDFTEAAGACGHYLYSLLQDIRTHGVQILPRAEEAPPPGSVQREEKTYSKPETVKKHKFHNHSRHGIHSSHLWEFLRDLLLSPEDNDGILDWEDREQGIFRVVKSEALARMWGQRKRNDRMNYEKLSRALRHYYKTGILERVDRRLVYKFGKNAHGWH